MILLILELFLLAIFGVFPIYLALLSILALLPYKPGKKLSPPKRSFAVVVPAHDEELVIGKTLESLFSLDYPRDQFEIIIIADNCTDQTAEISRSLGATVFVRNNLTNTGKGFALRWCFDSLLNSSKHYDAVVVIDADCEVSRNTLAVLDSHLDRGARAVQIADLVKPNPGAWNSEIVRLGFTLYNVVRPFGKRKIGCSVGLRGTGMCLSTGVLRDIPWQAFSYAEDLEYGLNLLLKGVSVDFAPEARVVSSMPDKPKDSETQRTRWESGRKPLVKFYAPKLLSSSFKKMSYPLFDAFLDLIIPPFVNLSVIIVFIILLHVILAVSGLGSFGIYLWIWTGIFGAACIHALFGLLAAKADKFLYKSILYVPRYAVWKIGLYGKLIIHGGPNKWVRTKRELHDNKLEKEFGK
ncbi:MAG: glycosyltransferase family 2 protein [Bacteroidota bacterium]